MRLTCPQLQPDVFQGGAQSRAATHPPGQTPQSTTTCLLSDRHSEADTGLCWVAGVSCDESWEGDGDDPPVVGGRKGRLPRLGQASQGRGRGRDRPFQPARGSTKWGKPRWLALRGARPGQHVQGAVACGCSARVTGPPRYPSSQTGDKGPAWPISSHQAREELEGDHSATTAPRALQTHPNSEPTCISLNTALTLKSGYRHEITVNAERAQLLRTRSRCWRGGGLLTLTPDYLRLQTEEQLPVIYSKT